MLTGFKNSFGPENKSRHRSLPTKAVTTVLALQAQAALKRAQDTRPHLHISPCAVNCSINVHENRGSLYSCIRHILRKYFNLAVIKEIQKLRTSFLLDFLSKQRCFRSWLRDMVLLFPLRREVSVQGKCSSDCTCPIVFQSGCTNSGN